MKEARQEGFSLVESMIAVAILAISVLGLAQLMAVATQQSAYSRSSTMATEVALRVMEDLRNQYNNQVATATADADLGQGLHEGTGASPAVGPGATVTLAAPSGSAMSDVVFNASWVVVDGALNEKTVTVTVTPQIVNETVSASAILQSIFSP